MLSRLWLLFSLMIFPVFKVTAQEYLKMKCVWATVINGDSISTSNEYLGRTLSVSREIFNDSVPQNKLYTIGGIPNFIKRGNNLFIKEGIDYWICFDKVIFSEDFQYMTIRESRPVLGLAGSVGSKAKVIITYYIANPSVEPCTSQEEFERIYLKIRNCPRCKGTGQVKPNLRGGPDESVGICPLCGGHAKDIISPFK